MQLASLETVMRMPPSESHSLSTAVARIALVKPDKAQMVENLCLQMAQRGQLTEKVCQKPEL